MDSTPRPLAQVVVLAASCFLFFGLAANVSAQVSPDEERLMILRDPEAIKKKLDKEKTKPPLEIFRTQVAPFDVLPFVKPRHWSSFTLETIANYEDYAGTARTAPVRMVSGNEIELPQEIIYQREARLSKGQRARLSFPLMLPAFPTSKVLEIELIQPDAIRPDELWPASLRPLGSHQMLILFLTKEPSGAYPPWDRYQAMFPTAVDRQDANALDRARYFRSVHPLEPEKPPLSGHPLTWTTISHVVWDGMPPDNLNPQQQQAMLDWLHWGGQLILVGGAGPSFALLKDSFLSPYLPGEPSGENASLKREDLNPLAVAYPPPYRPTPDEADEEDRPADVPPAARSRTNDRYLRPSAIRPKENRPVFLLGLRPSPGSQSIPFGEGSTKVLGVEKRVGRGRVLMLALNPTDPALASWPGLDTLIRRVILRRPEENRPIRGAAPGGERLSLSHYGALTGPELSWVRYVSRDMGAPINPLRASNDPVVNLALQRGRPVPDVDGPDQAEREYLPSDAAVAEWVDSSALPRYCRDVLEEASGIKIPGASFVLKVVLAYILLLVPLNWLLCRYAFNRRELAWVLAPLLSIAFAVGVERAAAYDMGYNTACDEIDILELHGDYPRAHLSRFASLYSNGRTRFTIAFPNDPTALALPLDIGRALRGEDVQSAVFQSYPVPALRGFLVQPRSLGMFRSEQMASMDGVISLETEGDVRRVVNQGSLELRDARLIDLDGSKEPAQIYLGTIEPGATVEVKPVSQKPAEAREAKALQHERLLERFATYYENRPENQGEIRLVAWVAKPMVGPTIEPPVDRHRGFTAVVVHLRNGPPPNPDGPTYNALATNAVSPSPESTLVAGTLPRHP
jgi:hypothetical protein